MALEKKPFGRWLNRVCEAQPNGQGLPRLRRLIHPTRVRFLKPQPVAIHFAFGPSMSAPNVDTVISASPKPASM